MSTGEGFPEQTTISIGEKVEIHSLSPPSLHTEGAMISHSETTRSSHAHSETRLSHPHSGRSLSEDHFVFAKGANSHPPSRLTDYFAVNMLVNILVHLIVNTRVGTIRRLRQA